MSLRAKQPAICVAPPPIYLHFLNRELLRGLALNVEDVPVMATLAALFACTSERLFSSLAFIWEASFVPQFLQIVGAAHGTGDLTVVSSLPTPEDYLYLAQKHYAHDQNRYPMYFRHVPSRLIDLRPDLIKLDDTSIILSHQLRMWAEGMQHDAWAALSPTDMKSLVSLQGRIGSILDTRDQKAITLSLFESELKRFGLSNARLPLARLLSLLHLRHYLDSIGADIATGISGLAYFDYAAETFPIFDVSLLLSMLENMNISIVDSCDAKDIEAIIASRRSETHRRFVAGLRFLLNASLYRVWKETYSADHLARRDSIAQTLNSMLALGRWEPAVRRSLALHLDRLGGELEKVGLLATREKDLLEFSAMYREHAAVKKKRVLILTATGLETRTVSESIRLQFGNTITKTYFADHTVYLCGPIDNCDVYLVQSEMGTESPSAMTLTANDMVEALMPDSVILTGIAFGLRPDKQKVGDVIVSKQITLYDPKKLAQIKGQDVWLARGDRPQASTRLLDRFRSASLDWKGPNVHFGLLLSGNTLVNSPSFIEALKQIEPEAVGGEMEGAGVYAVGAKRKVDWIVVKGISDWGFDKSDERQEFAATNATGLILHVIAGGGLGV